MDVSKTPPLPPAPPATEAPQLARDLAAQVAAQFGAELGAGLDSNASTLLAALQDRVDIRSLDVPAALQIVIAEVRSDFASALLDVPAPASTAAPLSVVSSTPDVVSTPAMLLDLFLRALPAPRPDAADWSAAVARVEATLQGALQRAVDTVAAWRDAAPAVVETVKQVQAQVLALIVDEPISPLWLSPEWLGLRPRMASYWRRRRAARRRLLDPDYSQRHWEAECAAQRAAPQEENDS